MSIVVTASSGHLGRDVTHRPLTPEAHLQALVDAGAPDPMAQMAVGVDAGIRAGAFAFTNGDLARLLGRPTTPLAEGLGPLT